MARKFLYFIAALIVLALGAMLVLSIWSRELTRFAFVPRGEFEQLAPLAPDRYADTAMWIARPGMGTNDPAQWLPQGFKREQASAGAAVFFIHPTSYLARGHWNGPLGDADASRRAGFYVRGMASAFNGAGDVWAPRYRQAAFGAFLTDAPQAQQALDLAYADVRQAFAAFLAAVPADQPIVLAGHSQGALHLIRLLHGDLRGTPAARRIAAAYVVGWPVSVQHDLPQMGLPACAAPHQAGCVMSWSSFAEPADTEMVVGAYRARPALDGQAKGPQPVLCTNPLTGRTGGSAPASANLGTLVPSEDLTGGTITTAAVPARCDAATGLLMIGDPPKVGPFVLPGNNYHIYDIPLFWANVRADVARRAAAWRDEQASAQ